MNVSRWKISHKLAVLSLALGVLALAGDPGSGSKVVLDTQALANIVDSEVDHITVEELADWIIQNRSNYRLIDLRDEAEYVPYHIPTAERVSIRDLRDYPLYRNEKIVLYSDGRIHAAQAWFLLRAEGYAGSYILLGGLDLWKDEILFPMLSDQASQEERENFKKRISVSRYFGGRPRIGDVEQLEAKPMPVPKMDLPPPIARPKKTKRQKEGC
jgi:rhodanese-related sulfurtransferase